MTEFKKANLDNLKPFLNPDIPSLAIVIELIGADESFPKPKRKRMISSLNTLAKIVGKDPRQVPANLDWIIRKNGRFHPTQANISKKRWANIKSHARFIFRHVGIVEGNIARQHPLSEAWQVLVDLIPEPLERQRWNVVRFTRYCSAAGIEPADVTNDAVLQFLAALKREDLLHDPKQTVRNAVNAWNKLRDELAGWPNIALAGLPKKERWTFPLDTFPTRFNEDLEAWLDTLGAKSRLSGTGPIKPLSKATIKHHRFKVRQIASALVHTGVAIEEVDCLAVLVEPENLRKALRSILDRYEAKGRDTEEDPPEAVYKLAAAMLGLARHYVKPGDEALDEIKVMCQELNPGKRGLTAKNRAWLRQLDDPHKRHLFLNLPWIVARQVVGADRLTRNNAVRFSTAIAFAVLQYAPVRMKNLRSIEIGEHLLEASGGKYWLVFREHEVKNDEPLEYELPREVGQLIKLYLKTYHPRLTATPSVYLFPGAEADRAKCEWGLARLIKDMAAEIAGMTVSPHWFRHSAVRLLLEAYPDNYEAARRLLGHKDINTTTRIYSGLGTRAASKLYHEVLRKDARAAARRSKRSKASKRRKK